VTEWFPKRTLGALPADAARRWGHREAVLFKGQRSSFAELSDRIDRVAAGLIRSGVAPGEKVALWMVNRPEFIHAAFAVFKIGAVLVPVNTRFRREDLAYVLQQSDTSTLVIADRSGTVDYLGIVRSLVPSLDTGELREPQFPALKRVIVVSAEPVRGAVHWDGMIAAAGASADHELRARADAVDPDATAFFMYTSGTTGFPKGRCTTTPSSATSSIAGSGWRSRPPTRS
jgi:fatty-acyl-CoA synthase